MDTDCRFVQGCLVGRNCSSSEPRRRLRCSVIITPSTGSPLEGSQRGAREGGVLGDFLIRSRLLHREGESFLAFCMAREDFSGFAANRQLVQDWCGEKVEEITYFLRTETKALWGPRYAA